MEEHPHRHHHKGTAKLRNPDKEKTQQKRPEKKGNGQNTQSTESEQARRSVCEPRDNTRPQQNKNAHGGCREKPSGGLPATHASRGRGQDPTKATDQEGNPPGCEPRMRTIKKSTDKRMTQWS